MSLPGDGLRHAPDQACEHDRSAGIARRSRIRTSAGTVSLQTPRQRTASERPPSPMISSQSPTARQHPRHAIRQDLEVWQYGDPAGTPGHLLSRLDRLASPGVLHRPAGARELGLRIIASEPPGRRPVRVHGAAEPGRGARDVEDVALGARTWRIQRHRPFGQCPVRSGNAAPSRSAGEDSDPDQWDGPDPAAGRSPRHATIGPRRPGNRHALSIAGRRIRPVVGELSLRPASVPRAIHRQAGSRRPAPVSQGALTTCSFKTCVRCSWKGWGPTAWSRRCSGSGTSVASELCSRETAASASGTVLPTILFPRHGLSNRPAAAELRGPFRPGRPFRGGRDRRADRHAR